MTPNPKLHVFRKEAIPWREALETVSDRLSGGSALVYGRSACVFARIGASGLDFGPNRPAEVAYELRAFNQACELRWLAEADHFEGSDPLGCGVLLSEDGTVFGAGAAAAAWSEVSFASTRERPYDRTPERFREGRYLLWGRKEEEAGGQDGWTRLLEHRVGGLWAPLTGVPARGRAALCYTEYLARDDEHGNLTVAAERLTGLAAHPG